MIAVVVLVLVIVCVSIFVGLVAWSIGEFVHRVLHNKIGLVSRWLVGMLAVQFILGMAANLFQKIPASMPWRVFHEFGPIVVHAANGLAIVVLAMWPRVLAGRQKRFVVPASIGGIATAVAFVCGVAFVNFGQNDVYSYVMSLGFLVAFLEFTYIGFCSLNH